MNITFKFLTEETYCECCGFHRYIFCRDMCSVCWMLMLKDMPYTHPIRNQLSDKSGAASRLFPFKYNDVYMSIKQMFPSANHDTIHDITSSLFFESAEIHLDVTINDDNISAIPSFNWRLEKVFYPTMQRPYDPVAFSLFMGQTHERHKDRADRHCFLTGDRQNDVNPDRKITSVRWIDTNVRLQTVSVDDAAFREFCAQNDIELRWAGTNFGDLYHSAFLRSTFYVEGIIPKTEQAMMLFKMRFGFVPRVVEYFE